MYRFYSRHSFLELESFWIPWRLFWGYLSGVILLLAGVRILLKREPRVAAKGLGIMILSMAVLTYGGAWILARTSRDLIEVRLEAGQL